MSRRRAADAGFTIVELLVAVTVMLLVLAGTAQIMSDALTTTAATRDVIDMNSHLRAGMDLIHRDLLQAGQGLPVGRRIGVPNGEGAQPIGRPGPDPQGDCPGVDPFPDEPSLPAVSVGAGLGPPINDECTDVITVLAADNLFGQVPVVEIAENGSTVTLGPNPDLEGDTLRAGDLLMLVKGAMSVLVQVTAVAGQVATLAGGALDPLGLNQRDVSLNMQGTINQLRALPPANGLVEATRIRMVTYFVDTTTTPGSPRLVRQVGGGMANAVALGIQAFRLTYDITDQLNNPAGVRMDVADLTGTGACSPDPCFENQIRKVNVLLSMTADDTQTHSRFKNGRQSQNTLLGQVSLRSMAFVDRYR